MEQTATTTMVVETLGILFIYLFSPSILLQVRRKSGAGGAIAPQILGVLYY